MLNCRFAKELKRKPRVSQGSVSTSFNLFKYVISLSQKTCNKTTPAVLFPVQMQKGAIWDLLFKAVVRFSLLKKIPQL